MEDKKKLNQRLLEAINPYQEFINEDTYRLITHICNWLNVTELEGFVDFVESEEKGE